MLRHEEILMPPRIILDHRQNLEAALRVKGWSLEGERRKKHLRAPTSTSLVFCCREEFRPDTLAPLRLFDPELPNFTTTAPGIPANPGDNLSAVVSHEDGQPGAIGYSR